MTLRPRGWAQTYLPHRHVTPLPKPIYLGNIRQGMPLLRTNHREAVRGVSLERINPHAPTMGGVQQRATGVIAQEVEVLAAFPNSLAHGDAGYKNVKLLWLDDRASRRPSTPRATWFTGAR